MASPQGPWFIRSGGVVQGPVSSADVNRMLQTGTVTPETEVAQSAAGPWQPAGMFRRSAGAATETSPRSEPRNDRQLHLDPGPILIAMAFLTAAALATVIACAGVQAGAVLAAVVVIPAVLLGLLASLFARTDQTDQTDQTSGDKSGTFGVGIALATAAVIISLLAWMIASLRATLF